MQLFRRVGGKREGFTIVELLIVVVVIAILAAITIVAYNGITSRAQASKISADLTMLQKAVIGAREATQQTMLQITSSSFTSANCRSGSIPDGSDLSALPKTDGCWTAYNQALDRISAASGMNVRGMVDPWGWPYYIDENEGESGGCGRDSISVFTRPLNTYAVGSADALSPANATYGMSIPKIGLTGCAPG